MANRPLLAITGLATSSVLLAASVVGCSSNKSSTASSSSKPASSAASSTATSSANAAPSDPSGLLIKATDINVPNDTFTATPAKPIPGDNPAITVQFTNPPGTRIIGDTIMILPDASAAATALEGSKAAIASSTTGPLQPSSVGSNGVIASGPSPDNSRAATVLLFTEGRAFATIEFDSAPDDPVPPEVVTDIGQKQDAAIKAGLPG